MTLTVLVCGGGNGSHVMAGLAGCRPGVKVRVLSLYSDEAERWAKALETSDMTITGRNLDGKLETKVSKPELVTKDPSKAVPGAQMICFVVPAFAHEQYFKAICPYLQDGTVIAGVPSAAGFEFAAHDILGEKAKTCTFMTYESLPWSCRIQEYGKHAQIIGFKETLAGGIRLGSHPPSVPPKVTIQMLVGSIPKLNTKGHLLGVSLMGTNSYLHPCIMYGKWEKSWDGKPLKEKPFFYHGVDEFSGTLLGDVSAEIVKVGAAILAKHPEVDLSIVRPMYQWYQECYYLQMTDRTNLTTCILTNSAYAGLCHPCKELEDGTFVPDFSNRYLSEDIPFGLSVIRGVAELIGVSTPKLDMVLRWGQSKLGKEFLKGDSMCGKDLAECRAPQKYGIKTLEEALNC